MSSESYFDELKKAFFDRVDSPVSGTFAISWILFNWKIPLAIIFGDVSEKNRIDFVEEILLSYGIDLYCRTIIYPTLATLIYLVVMPYLKELNQKHNDKVEERSSLRKAQIQADFQEINSHRATLKNIAHAHLQHLRESSGAFESIKTMAGNQQKGLEYLPAIKKHAEDHHGKLIAALRTVENFDVNYRPELNWSISNFLNRWGDSVRENYTIVNKNFSNKKHK